jgi:hypothetical protein
MQPTIPPRLFDTCYHKQPLPNLANLTNLANVANVANLTNLNHHSVEAHPIIECVRIP